MTALNRRFEAFFIDTAGAAREDEPIAAEVVDQSIKEVRDEALHGVE